MQARTFILAVAAAALVSLTVIPAAASAGDGGICAGCEPAAGGGGGKVLTLPELRDLARETGFARPKVAAAIAMAESSGRVRAVNRNSKPRRSVDRGLFQINSRWHPEVSRSCALDALCNAREALRISEGGREWRQWTTWHNGAYRAYL